MILYAVIMFLVAILFGILAASISKGNIQLIHDYHRTRVTDPKAYGKAFGKALLIVGLTPLVSGIIGFFGDSKPFVITAIAVLLIGFCVGLTCICIVQKKYNSGIF